MAYKFTFTPRFQKHFKNLTVPEKIRLKSKLELLAQDPSHPSLRTKRIQGTTDLFECSVNMVIHIIPTRLPSPRAIQNTAVSYPVPRYPNIPMRAVPSVLSPPPGK